MPLSSNRSATQSLPGIVEGTRQAQAEDPSEAGVRHSAVTFELYETFPGWDRAPSLLKGLIQRYGARRILEVGSGANPTVEPDFIRQHGLVYVTSDTSAEELEKADPAYDRVVCDMSANEIGGATTGEFDLIFSRMVGEHIQDGRKFHENVHRLLRSGGISAHCFSTLWCLPFALNRILPEFLSDRLLRVVAPRNRHQQGKFPAKYSWSRGPTPAMLRRFQAIGFDVLRYTGYFGHSYYRRVSPWLHEIEMRKARLLLRRPAPLLCSYATLVLRKR